MLLCPVHRLSGARFVLGICAWHCVNRCPNNSTGKRANNETCHQVCAELFLLAFLVIGLNLDGDSPACFKVTIEADLVCAPWINNGTVLVKGSSSVQPETRLRL